MNKKTSFLFNKGGIFYLMKKTCAFVWLILCCFLWTTPVLSAQIKNIRLAKYQPNVVRLVVETNEKPDAKVFTLSNPDRLVVDFKNTYFSKSAPSKIASVDFIKSIRRGLPDKQTARLVLELPNKNITENHFNLKPSDKNGWRFVVDIKKDETTKTKYWFYAGNHYGSFAHFNVILVGQAVILVQGQQDIVHPDGDVGPDLLAGVGKDGLIQGHIGALQLDQGKALRGGGADRCGPQQHKCQSHGSSALPKGMFHIFYVLLREYRMPCIRRNPNI